LLYSRCCSIRYFVRVVRRVSAIAVLRGGSGMHRFYPLACRIPHKENVKAVALQ
jgi:hypothetical protein